MRFFLKIFLCAICWINSIEAKPLQPIYSGDLSELFQMNVITYGLEKMGYKVAPTSGASYPLLFGGVKREC